MASKFGTFAMPAYSTMSSPPTSNTRTVARPPAAHRTGASSTTTTTHARTGASPTVTTTRTVSSPPSKNASTSPATSPRTRTAVVAVASANDDNESPEKNAVSPVHEPVNKPRSLDERASQLSEVISVYDMDSFSNAYTPQIVLLQRKGYKIESFLGKGSQGTVILATTTKRTENATGNDVTRTTEERKQQTPASTTVAAAVQRNDAQGDNQRLNVAVKIIKTSTLSEQEQIRLDRELEANRNLSHKHVVPLIEDFTDADCTFMVFEYMSQGDLADLLHDKPEGLPEDEALELFKQIALVITYLHSNEICHRDIKLDNFLLDSVQDEEGNSRRIVKCIDFGAVHLGEKEGTFSTQVCGTPMYFPPEMFVNHPKYFPKEADIWSMGVLFYLLLSSAPPFGKSFDEVKENLTSTNTESPLPVFTGPTWQNISENTKNIIGWMLKKDGRHRPTAFEVLQCLMSVDSLSPADIGFDVPRKLQSRALSANDLFVRVRSGSKQRPKTKNNDAFSRMSSTGAAFLHRSGSRTKTPIDAFTNTSKSTASGFGRKSSISHAKSPENNDFRPKSSNSKTKSPDNGDISRKSSNSKALSRKSSNSKAHNNWLQQVVSMSMPEKELKRAKSGESSHKNGQRDNDSVFVTNFSENSDFSNRSLSSKPTVAHSSVSSPPISKAKTLKSPTDLLTPPERDEKLEDPSRKKESFGQKTLNNLKKLGNLFQKKHSTPVDHW